MAAEDAEADGPLEVAETAEGEAAGDRAGSSDFASLEEDASGNSGNTDAEGSGATAGELADAPQANVEAAAPRCSDTSWRVRILEQVAARDQMTRGVEELYEQYSECLRGLQTSRHSSAGSFCQGTGPCPSPSGGSSPAQGPRPGPPLPPQEDLELPRAAPAAPGSADGAQGQASAQDLRRKFAQSLRSKEKELEALQQVVEEREEELREKEQAHTAVCRQATLLGRENAELKAQLERTQQELQAKTSETDRLLSELTRLRDAEAARLNGGGGGEKAASEAPVLPAKQRVFRKIHDAELTCIAAAGMQGAPLPKNLVAIGTADGFVKLLDGTTARLHAHLSVSRELPRLVAVDLSEGSGLLLAASSDHAMRLLDLRAQRLQHTLRGHLGPLSACGFLRAGSHAFTASADRTVKLWDLERGQTLRSTPASGPVTAAGVHSSSGVVVTGHGDGSLSVWDPRVSDTLSVPTPGHAGRGVVGLRLSPDGRFALSQADDGTVCHIALDKMQALLTLSGLGPVSAPSLPAYSLDGAHILARDAKSLCCWSVASGERVCEHEVQATLCACWDLPQAVSAHENGHVALWGAAEGS